MKGCFFFACILGTYLLFGQARTTTGPKKDWKFHLGDDSTAINPKYNDSKWRSLLLPHYRSIEGSFSEEHNTTLNEGALPAGIGWHRKTFNLPATSRCKRVFINFNGIYKNSEFRINGYFMGIVSPIKNL